MEARIGQVQSVNKGNRTVRAFFQDVGIMSGDLRVLRRQSDPEYTEYESGGSGYAEFANHRHLTDWFPKINDNVLVIYTDGFNSDGIVVGVI